MSLPAGSFRRVITSQVADEARLKVVNESRYVRPRRVSTARSAGSMWSAGGSGHHERGQSQSPLDKLMADSRQPPI